MNAPYTAEDWIPRDDMAVLAGCSPDTIRRAEKKHQLETRADDAGRVLVKVGDFLCLGRLSEADLTAGATPAESAAMARSRHAEAALREQVARLEGRLAQVDMLVQTLREQLATKDKQLAKGDDQVTQLTGLLGRLAVIGDAA